jgi:hypothetical protein
VTAFSSLQELATAGHAADSAVYVLAQAIFAQPIRPPVVKVGRRTTSTPQVIRFLPADTTVGKVYRVAIRHAGGVVATAEYTVVTADTPTLISTGLKAAIDALLISGLTTTLDSATLVCTGAAGKRFVYSAVSPWLTVTDATAATDLAANLAAVRAEDDDWYALVPDAQSKAAHAALAPVVETTRKIAVLGTADSEVKDGAVTNCVASANKSGSYARTVLLFHSHVGGAAHAAWLAGRLVANPGSDTWAFKTLRGIPADVHNSTVRGVLETKRANYYQNVADVGTTLFGVSGAGEYADVTRGVDWLVARIQERIFALLHANEKLPYTDAGIETIGNEVRAQLAIAESDDHRLLTPGSSVVELPKSASVPSGDKVARVLNNIRFAGELQGAVHKLSVNGTLTP